MSARSFASEKFRKTVQRGGLFGAGERLLVGVSGGIDSVSLLHLLLSLPKSMKPEVVVAHFNHRLRGGESDGEARFVEELSRKWGVPFQGGEAPPWVTRENLEARARELRYRFFREKGREGGIRKIVTGHQADDQAETFLIRWLQGAGLTGLSGISLLREEEDCLLIRPLLLIGRSEIAAYARHYELPFRTDPTNLGGDNLRSRIRKWLSAVQAENPKIAERTAVNSLFLKADDLFLDSAASSFFDASVEKGPGRIRCPIAAYQRLPKAIRYRLLRKIAGELVSNRHPLSGEAVLKIDELLDQSAPRKRYDLTNRLRFSKEYVWFDISKNDNIKMRKLSD